MEELGVKQKFQLQPKVVSNQNSKYSTLQTGEENKNDSTLNIKKGKHDFMTNPYQQVD